MSHLTQSATHKAFISTQTGLTTGNLTAGRQIPAGKAYVVLLYNKSKQDPVCGKGD